VAVIAGAGQALSGDRAAFGACTGLQHVEQTEAHGLLAVGVAVDLDVGTVPEFVQIVALRLDQTIPSAVLGTRYRAEHLVAQRRPRAQARPSVSEKLDDPQPLPGAQPADYRRARPILTGFGAHFDAAWYVDLMLHRGGHHQAAASCPVHEQRSSIARVVLYRLQWIQQHCGDPWIVGRRRLVLIRDEFGLHGDKREFADSVHHVLDGRHTALGK
jgi:hypothetical protein